ncbi:MAG: hypothetical protein ACK4YP_23530 [Myxococcota bacterium]
MSIRGIPQLPEPTFRTADDAWVSLDSVVRRVCTALGGDVSPLVAKCTIQLARHAAHHVERVDIGQLAADVCAALRGERIVVTPIVVQQVLLAYASEVASLGVVQVEEG